MDNRQEQLPVWMTIVCLMMFVVAIIGSCQAYYDCIDDGRPSYECGHYARPWR